MDFKSLNMGMLKKLTSPQSSKDLNAFLEKLPQNAGNTVLVAAGIVWGISAALGLVTMVKAQELTELRAELKETQALSPSVPKITEGSIPQKDIEAFVEKMKKTYKGLDVKKSSAGIQITSTTTSNFGQFREAVAHVSNGGANWRINLDQLCVGRECNQNDKLAVSLSIKQVSVENPNN